MESPLTRACPASSVRRAALSRFRPHALQKAKRIERTNGDQFEAHQLFEHFVSDRRIGDVDDERHAGLSLRLFKTWIDGPDGENFGCRRRFHSGPLCVCGIHAVPTPCLPPCFAPSITCATWGGRAPSSTFQLVSDVTVFDFYPL